jgi:hydrogenase nickel incorporation protein HypA/HybF
VHELSVTESILNAAISHAQKANAKKVTDLHLVIGTLSSIVDDSVQFYWEMISMGTLCEGSQLHFKRLNARVLCQDCKEEYDLEYELLPCPNCGGMNIKIFSGDEFRLESIEIQ